MLLVEEPVCNCGNNIGYIFVCAEVLRPSQPIGVISNMVSLPNPAFSWAGSPQRG